jgi:hypothetical protein
MENKKICLDTIIIELGSLVYFLAIVAQKQNREFWSFVEKIMNFINNMPTPLQHQRWSFSHILAFRKR